MALETYGAFYLTEQITIQNAFVNFREGGAELTAELNSGLYNIEALAVELQTRLNSVGGLTYGVVFDRVNKRITISADGAFDLLTLSGSNAGSSPWSIFGFSQAGDLIGQTSYSSNLSVGREYVCQFPLQDYVGPGEWIEKVQPSVNETASGKIETITFGDREILEMTFKYITDLPMDGKVIKTNLSGVQAAKDFFNNIILKGPFEYMPDEKNRNVFYILKLESTPTSADGLGFKLIEETQNSLPNIYKIGPLKMRRA